MTKHLAVSGIAQCFLGLTILVMASKAALADPVYLSCVTGSAWPPFVLKLDISNKTISGDSNYGIAPYGNEPTVPRSIVVSNDEISWVVDGISNNSLSRVTGSFVAIGIGTSTGARWSAQCQKSERQF